MLLSGAPAAVLVDVSHGVSPGDIRSAAYILGRTWHRFPTGSIHIVVIDPGVGSPRAALALRSHNHYFTGPDNGVFTSVLKDTEVEAVTLPTPEWASPTFHGRDLFAPAAAALANGGSATVTASAPSEASPTTRMCGARESDRRSPSRTTSWSSTMRQVISEGVEGVDTRRG